MRVTNTEWQWIQKIAQRNKMRISKMIRLLTQIDESWMDDLGEAA